MRGRVILLFPLLVLLSASSQLFAECTYTPVYSAAFRTSVLDLAIDGGDLWTATSYGVRLYDRTIDPPALVASLAVPGVTRVIRVAGANAYVGSGAALYVVRKSGKSLQIVRTVSTAGTVNDIVYTTTTLYVATSSGLFSYDLLDPTNPTLLPATLPTSSPTVISLALSGSTLYAADGDSSVELFSLAVPGLPQGIGSLTSLPRSTSVKVAGSRLFVSDGQQTEVFGTGSSSSRLASIANGSTALVPLTSDVVFAAGNDRRIRAIDYATVASPVELFETDLSPSAGSVNRILSMQIAGGRLYAAGGDLGLLTWNIASFTAPFPVRSYSFASTSSVFSSGPKVYVTPSGGGITELIQNVSGQLTQGRHWSTGATAINDGGRDLLVTTVGATVTYWTLISTIPTPISSVTFAKPVQSAVIAGSTVYAVADRKLWSADMSLQTPTPVAIPIAGVNPSTIARSGNAIAISDIRDDGTTTISFFATPDFTKAPFTASVAGIAATPIALSGTLAAIFTFRGISVIDFAAASPTPVVLPQSNQFLARSLAMSGTTLLELIDGQLLVWDAKAASFTRQLALPADAVAVHVSSDQQSDLADVATGDGVASVAFRAASQTPAAVATPNGNAYYRKIAANAGQLYLFDGRGVDIYSTASTAPHLVTGLRQAGLIDFAVTSTAVYTLASSGVVTAYSTEGAMLGQTTLSEGSDAQPLAIGAAGGAPWIALSTGCLTGGCQKITVILDPSSLVKTASLSGGMLDVATAGTTAYALFDLPAEIRAFNVADPLHPAQTAARATEGTRVPVSIAFAGGNVLVLGDKLYQYDSALSKVAETFNAYVADGTGTLAYVDQRIRADGNCGVVSGRLFNPLVGTLPLLQGATSYPAPAPVRSLAVQNGRFLLLTDNSLEILSTSAATPKEKRRRVN
jgi:hypothetical protein